MKKKLLVLAMCLITAASLAACGSAMSYDDYDLSEYIEPGKYKGLETEGYTVKVTDEEVDDKIQEQLEAAAETVTLVKNDEVKIGDTVNIDYVGTKDGKAFDNGSAEGYDLVIGSGSFIDGFETGLVNKKVGQEVKLELTFPEDYSTEELQGQDVVFDVKINSATRKVVPEYNKDFVKKNTEYDSVKEYEKAVEKELYDSKEDEAVQNQKEDLWSQALENTEVKKYPERELEHYIEFNDKQMDDMADAYGISREEMLSKYNFKDEEEFEKVNDESSKLRIKQEMLLEYIADKEGIEYTEEEKEKLLADFEKQGYDEDEIEEQTGRTADEYVHIELLYQKVLDFLLENAVIK
ncbi:MAG: trigger factor [Bacillota bacterium]|nr:trigger factor [Bacillota bacterium]